MNTAFRIELFSQRINAASLNALTARIVARIGDGRPAEDAGFLWYGNEHEASKQEAASFPRAA